jgi:hypothetical protein
MEKKSERARNPAQRRGTSRIQFGKDGKEHSQAFDCG